MNLKVKRNYQTDNYLSIVVLFFRNLPNTSNQPNEQHKVILLTILSGNMEQSTKNDPLAEMKYL